MATEPRDPSTPLSAASRPVARVLPLLGLPHLDRSFDYLVKAEQDEAARPGTKVRIRFSGRLVDAVLLERRSTTDHGGRLSYLDRVISEEVVYPERISTLVEQLANRYGATRSDLIRAAIPARHAGAEDSDTRTPWEELGETSEPDLSAWASYEFGQSFVDAVLAGTTARAAWQIAPGERWADALAALAVKVVLDGYGALLVVPDQRDVDHLEAACRKLVSAKQITVLTASQGPQARYRRFLSVLHGQGRLVIGTRSAAFAPVDKLRLAVILHDGDDNLADPRAPYHHAREVLTTRSTIEGASLILAGHSRTAEAQLMVNSGWAHDLVASRSTLRARSPLIRASADSDFEMMRDPRAGQARLPKIAFDAARRALDLARPVLVQVPRKGYVPTLSCGTCRHPARCRACNGPLGLPDGGSAAVPTCRWCGRPETHFRCGECGSTALRAVVLGAGRTAEELGRAFTQTRVMASGGNRILDEIPPGPALVVATPGAEPRISDGSRYGAALLLDTWALLGRQDLRAAEDTLAKWTAVATMVESGLNGGEVIVTADAGLEIVQSFIRWDVVGAAQRELHARAEVGFPPTVHMAAIDGPSTSLERMRELIELPTGGEYLGPVPLPEHLHLPGEYDENTFGPPQRLLIRTPLGPRSELGRALREAAVARSAHKDELPLRIQVDPVQVG
ncbi:primosomal protein N' [Corynebacterium guangdongense]|uniref:Probable replication restart protein PriA n=1 Tax=Corynebacterium guangdongense TaxID=1783348 RepID=A0ABU1ZX23_9CORY|nr:primosomal protein N' [Corynebacterium guangdongense]MDR7329410.1 primosomal protein N' (replication factor Y) [Corynebacterium guangdongense]WJZ17975.1 Primosomal protein N' [Corynebacterium guangdongense]